MLKMLIEPQSRRAVLKGAGAAIAAPVLIGATPRIGAIVFDALVLFDSRILGDRASTIVGPLGKPLVSAWLAKLFGYSWLYTAAERYASFDVLAGAALTAAARDLRIGLPDGSEPQLVGLLSTLPVWPDVHSGLQALRDAGVRVAILSNLSSAMLASNLRTNGLQAVFESVLSTDGIKSFKPAPKAYEASRKALALRTAEIGFAASASWDAFGASSFGYKTVWINRSAAPPDFLSDAAPLVVAQDMRGAMHLAGVDVAARLAPEALAVQTSPCSTAEFARYSMMSEHGD
jgi:2-haloacid dehalogenase